MTGPQGESRPIPLRVDGLGLCMPARFGSLDALVAKAQQDVPGHYGSPI